MHPVIKGAEIETTGSVSVSLKPKDGVTLPEVNGTQVTLADFSLRSGPKRCHWTPRETQSFCSWCQTPMPCTSPVQPA